jgi:MoxR-like ATPase
MQISKTGLNKLSPSQIAAAICASFETKISLYVHGSPGISKSAIARQCADALGIAFIDVRLSQMLPEDIRGVPMMGEVDNMKGVIWTPPLVFPRDLDFDKIDEVDGAAVFRFYNPCGNNGVAYCTDPLIEVFALAPDQIAVLVTRKANNFTVSLVGQDQQPVRGKIKWRVTGTVRAILALEEFNSAPPSVMVAAYQLILDRRIGDYVVPNEVMILAMGNRDIDRGVTYQISKPVANRFIHVEMEFNWDDWFRWASTHAIAAEVIGFLTSFPNKTNDFRPDSVELSFATPRTWEFVSRQITAVRPPEPVVLRALICGAIGDVLGNEFLQHRKFMEDMPNIRRILDGSLRTFSPVNKQFETQIAYSVSVQLWYEVQRRAEAIEADYYGAERDFNEYAPRLAWFAQCDAAFAYIMANFRPDVAVMAATMALTGHKLRFLQKRMPHFSKFLKLYSTVVL